MSKLLQNIFAFALILFPALAFSETNLTFKGDFRFRNEEIKEEQASPLQTSDEFRQRIRVRAGAVAKVNEKSEVTLRFATGSSANTDGNTTNQTLTDYYSKKGIFVDLAYFNYKPTDNWQIWGGKSPITYYVAGGSDMVFDADLTPEGMAFKYKSEGDAATFFANLGSAWLAERYSATGATDNTDVGMVGGQIGVTKKMDNYLVTLAIANYNLSNVKGATAPAAKGNTLVAGAYAHSYNLTVGDLEVGTTIGDVPVSLYYEMVTNSDGGDYKTGGNVGVNIGKLKEVDSWLIRLDTREVEKDSTLGVLAESDSSGGGTDIRSTRLAGFYQVAENANIALTLFAGQRLISSTTFTPDYSRAQFDFNFQF